MVIDESEVLKIIDQAGEPTVKFIDVEGRQTSIIAPPVDHDHKTGFIRGILSEKLNLLLDQWEKLTYGKLSKPKELTDYQNDPPAYKCIGKVIYK